MVCRFLRKNGQLKNVRDDTDKLRIQKTDPHS